ncbi:MAG: group 1 truncated hemoglobin [Alcanivoracaceae bacterium]|nr:group 1 truncated hemoglobin [Alcanivoracaceae bacterium]
MKQIVLVALFAVMMSGCQTRPQDDLFESLGGMTGIENIVDDFLVRLGSDPRISNHFVDADPQRLREKLVEQFCAESGGGCEYTGDSMKDSHAGMGITRTDFNALVEDLVAAMEAQNVSVSAQNRLLKKLAPMNRDIVE